MITGLGTLARQFDELGKAAKALDGDITTINFDPRDSVSMRAAVREMERAVDRKVSLWRSNPMVANMAEQTKASMRQAIQKRARQALSGE